MRLSYPFPHLPDEAIPMEHVGGTGRGFGAYFSIFILSFSSNPTILEN